MLWFGRKFGQIYHCKIFARIPHPASHELMYTCHRQVLEFTFASLYSATFSPGEGIGIALTA